jgi:hypothetical protein
MNFPKLFGFFIIVKLQKDPSLFFVMDKNLILDKCPLLSHIPYTSQAMEAAGIVIKTAAADGVVDSSSSSSASLGPSAAKENCTPKAFTFDQLLMRSWSPIPMMPPYTLTTVNGIEKEMRTVGQIFKFFYSFLVFNLKTLFIIRMSVYKI